MVEIMNTLHGFTIKFENPELKLYVFNELNMIFIGVFTSRNMI